MTFTETNSVGGTLVQGGISAAALVFISSAINVMLPFAIAAIVLIIVDLHFGCEAARKKNEYKLSRAIRLTVNKVSEYVCWVILAATLSIAFNLPVINYIILGIVMGNELISIITNYLFLHNKRIKGLNSWFLRFLGSKLNTYTDGIEITEITEENEGSDNN